MFPDINRSVHSSHLVFHCCCFQSAVINLVGGTRDTESVPLTADQATPLGRTGQIYDFVLVKCKFIGLND